MAEDSSKTSEGTSEEEELDPRVQEELEKLNLCTEDINQLELQLEDANALFRTLLSDSTHQLKAMSKKLGSCIEKARPYYEAYEAYSKAQAECQSAATHYQRASGIHAAAKETIALAEGRFLSNSGRWQFDNAWQEMLNHATIKVMEAERQKTESEAVHHRKAASFQAAEAELHHLEKKLSKFITRSRPYFDQKDVFNKALAAQKVRVQELQRKVAASKSLYSRSLRNLEAISEAIHQKRRIRLPREPGVGAEINSLPSFDLDVCDGRSKSSSTVETPPDASSLSDASRSRSSVVSDDQCPQDHDNEEEEQKALEELTRRLRERLNREPPLPLDRSRSCPLEMTAQGSTSICDDTTTDKNLKETYCDVEEESEPAKLMVGPPEEEDLTVSGVVHGMEKIDL